MAGIKYKDRLDMGLICCEAPAAAAGVFTRNTVVAAPVTVSRERVKSGFARAILVNAGNANACTGRQGDEDALRTTATMAKVLGISPDEVLVCSTGVIGAPLPVETMERAMPGLAEALAGDIAPFAKSIMTTDLVEKVSSRRVAIGGVDVVVTGAAKGSGMIKPDMATMLGFIVTDAKVSPKTLQEVLSQAAELSFNRITVDGDTSTNDTLLMMASGLSGAPAVEGSAEALRAFSAAVEEVCRDLARMIVRDGEGATKLVDITVTGATDDGAAKAIAFTIAESPLVKTALHGEDPNWGRIAAALGRSGHFKGGEFGITVGEVPIVRAGAWLGTEAEKAARIVMQGGEFGITVEIFEGAGRATVTTCDFSAGYISINANYRS
jgi:glutamate N-acetyltransferase/amino-acid N-acetyltransferase